MIDGEVMTGVPASKAPIPFRFEANPQNVLQVEADSTRSFIDNAVPYAKYLLEAGCYCYRAIQDYEVSGAVPQSPDSIAKTKRRVQYEEAFNRKFPSVEVDVENMPRIVLLHGIGRNHREFDDYVAFLKSKGIKDDRILALDFPRYGSPVPGKSGQVYGFENLGEWVIEELARRGVGEKEKVSIFGQSLGALVSSYIAVNHQDRVANIIANSGPFRSKGSVVPEKMRKVVEGVLRADDRALRIIEFIKARLPSGPTTDFLRENSLEMLCQCYSDLFNIDWDTEVLSKIRNLPIISIIGENDGLLTALNCDGPKIIPDALQIREAGRGHNKPKPEYFWRMWTNEVKKLQA